MGSVKICYICDGLDECSGHFGCYKFSKTCADVCRHTMNPDHALNGMIGHPENYPDRFHKLDVPEEDNDIYWEGEIDIPWN